MQMEDGRFLRLCEARFCMYFDATLFDMLLKELSIVSHGLFWLIRERTSRRFVPVNSGAAGQQRTLGTFNSEADGHSRKNCIMWAQVKTGSLDLDAEPIPIQSPLLREYCFVFFCLCSPVCLNSAGLLASQNWYCLKLPCVRHNVPLKSYQM